jgi:hypothetical protein
LYTHLIGARPADRSFEAIRRLAGELAMQQGIPATESELEGCAVLYTLQRRLRTGDLAACAPLAQRAFELVRDDPTQGILRRAWVKQLIDASQRPLADAATLTYLEYLKGCDQSTRSTQHRIEFWSALLQQHPDALPDSVQFFTARFG